MFNKFLLVICELKALGECSDCAVSLNLLGILLGAVLNALGFFAMLGVAVSVGVRQVFCAGRILLYTEVVTRWSSRSLWGSVQAN